MPPKPQPLATLKLKNSAHAKYHRKTEPLPTPGMPERSERLTDAELEVYDYIISKLDNMGVLTITDGKAIERYAYNYVRYWQTAEFVREHGETQPVLDKEGNVKSHVLRPESQLLNTLNLQLLKMEQDFGLTPSSRAGIQLEKTQHEDKLKQKFFA